MKYTHYRKLWLYMCWKLMIYLMMVDSFKAESMYYVYLYALGVRSSPS